MTDRGGTWILALGASALFAIMLALNALAFTAPH